MRTYGLVLICALFCAACGNAEELAAKKKELKALKDKYKAVAREFDEKHPERQKILNTVIPAMGKLKRAKSRGDESDVASAQAEFDEAQAAAKDVTDAERALKDRMRDLKDEMAKVEKAILKLGGKP